MAASKKEKEVTKAVATEKVTKKESKKQVNKKKGTAKKENFFKAIKKEMALVKWPSFKEVLKYTISTLVFCLFICGFFMLMYFLLTLIVGGEI